MINEDKRLALHYGAIGATSLLLYMAFYPVNASLLAWFGLVPMLLASSAIKRTRNVFLYGAATGFLYHLIGLAWLALCTPEGWLVTTLLEAIYMGLSLSIATWIKRKKRWPYAFVLPFIWTLFDFERARFKFFAFPWMLIGQTQHSQDWLIQVIDVTGIYGPGFLVVMANALITDTLLHKTPFQAYWRKSDDPAPELGPFKRVQIGWGVLAGALLLCALYSAVRVGQVRAATKESAKLLLVQSDFPSRNDRPPLDSNVVTGRMLQLTEQAVRDYRGQYDAIIWPETTWYHSLNIEYLKLLERNRDRFPKPETRLRIDRMITNYKRLMRLPKQAKAAMIIGAIHHELADDGALIAKHNSAYLLTKDSEKDGPQGRFDKLKPVPVSEYIPGKDTLLFDWFFRLLKSMVPPGFSIFEYGEGPKVFEIKGHKIAPNICFDVSYGNLMRDVTLAGADLHVNMSNYSWFRSSQALEFALHQSKFRAIETRRGVVACVNSGPSCAFDPDGQLADGGKAYLAHFSPEQRRANGRINNEGSLLARTKTTQLNSFYMRFGDLFAWLMVLVSAVLFVLAWRNPAVPVGDKET